MGHVGLPCDIDKVVDRDRFARRDAMSRRPDQREPLLGPRPQHDESGLLHGERAIEIHHLAREEPGNVGEAQPHALQRQDFVQPCNVGNAVETPVLAGPARFDQAAVS